jgi:2-polyprenyl-3-methyl-5-hydroxy-6-metoxy-1,4-benzoquinol methylase
MQIDALLEMREHGRPRTLLFDPETKILHAKWSKDYCEPVRSEMLSLMPEGARSVLSIGCGWGATEGHLVRKGLRVVGVPMDSVIAACAEAKGVEMIYGDFETAREKLAHESFDCILLSNVLHLVRDPADVLSAFVELLSPQGVVIASTPNLGRMPIGLGRLRGKPQYRKLGSYEKTGLHLTSTRLVRKWFKQCRLKVERVEYMIPPRAEFAHRLLAGLADPLLGEELIARGRPANDRTPNLS